MQLRFIQQVDLAQLWGLGLVRVVVAKVVVKVRARVLAKVVAKAQVKVRARALAKVVAKAQAKVRARVLLVAAPALLIHV